MVNHLRPFNKKGLTLISSSNYMPRKVLDEVIFQFHTSTAALLEFRDGLVISSHDL